MRVWYIVCVCVCRCSANHPHCSPGHNVLSRHFALSLSLLPGSFMKFSLFYGVRPFIEFVDWALFSDLIELLWLSFCLLFSDFCIYSLYVLFESIYFLCIFSMRIAHYIVSLLAGKSLSKRRTHQLGCQLAIVIRGSFGGGFPISLFSANSSWKQ